MALHQTSQLLPAAIGKPDTITLLENLIGMVDFNTAPCLPSEITPIDGTKLGAGKNLPSLVPPHLPSLHYLAPWDHRHSDHDL